MKLLLIGMDGASEEIFQRGWTPFIASLLEKKTQLNITNDLLSRGWLEIATGEHASKTGAMYDMPEKGGGVKWKLDFSFRNIPGLGTSIKPIWQRLNEMGYKVGIMNLPTTFPAPEVDGFFVSGGGGGAPVTQAPTEALCYPKEILPSLLDDDYIVDDRLYQLMAEKNLNSPSEIFERLAYKNSRRTKSFVNLSNKYEIDFGFVVYKTSSVFAETFYNTEMVRRSNSSNKADSDLMKALERYYRDFDDEVRALQSKFPEAELVFVSDHGSCERKFSVNLNEFLKSEGFLFNSMKKIAIKKTISKIKELIPFTIKAYLKKSVAMKAKHVGQVGFDIERSLAFSKTHGDWSHGIFINDERFGGPVKVSDVNDVKCRIIEKFNNSKESIQHGLKAVSSNETGSVCSSFPDIKIILPNGYLTTDREKGFVTKFEPVKTQDCISSITKGDILNIKSHSPIAMFDDVNVNGIDYFNKEGHLGMVYDLILEKFRTK